MSEVLNVILQTFLLLTSLIKDGNIYGSKMDTELNSVSESVNS